jgi:hypothetical protein
VFFFFFETPISLTDWEDDIWTTYKEKTEDANEGPLRDILRTVQTRKR